MTWSEDGKIQLNRKSALGVALLITGLALTAMFLTGMLVAGTGNNTDTPVDTAYQEQGSDPEPSPQTASKAKYSTCLARTWRALSLDTEDADFKPWQDRSSTREVEDIIDLRHVDYISAHCHHLAPEPPETQSATCIQKELQSFYRRHIPAGKDSPSHRAIAAEYALTVCQPSADS